MQRKLTRADGLRRRFWRVPLLFASTGALLITGALLLTGISRANRASGGSASLALRALAPQRERGLDGRVTVFRDQMPLLPGVTITASRGAMAPITVHVRSLLYWEDLGHGFLFPHPSLLLLQDARSGRALIRRSMTSYPLINNAPAPFVRSASVYLTPRDAIYDRRPLTDLLGFLGRPVASAAATPDLSDDGLVTIGQRDDPALTYDFSKVTELAKELKLEHAPAEASEEGLVNAITKLKDGGKHDIVIFLGGHGLAPKGKGRSYKDANGEVINQPESATPQVTLKQTGNTATTISPSGITRILGKFPSLKFKLIIDSCFSGRFLEPLSKVSNLVITLTSTDADHVSVVGYGTAVFKAFQDWAATPDGTGVASGLRHAGASEEVKRWAAYFPDFLHPQVPAPPPPPPPPPPPTPKPPVLQPLSAVFMPDQFQTTYTESATDPDGRSLTYSWSFYEVNDSTCNKFNAGVPAPNQAVWHHADSDGCNHDLQGPNGHEGEITVLVVDGKFKCKATYSGSNTGTGPPPSPCTKVSG